MHFISLYCMNIIIIIAVINNTTGTNAIIIYIFSFIIVTIAIKILCFRHYHQCVKWYLPYHYILYTNNDLSFSNYFFFDVKNKDPQPIEPAISIILWNIIESLKILFIALQRIYNIVWFLLLNNIKEEIVLASRWIFIVLSVRSSYNERVRIFDFVISFSLIATNGALLLF